MAITYSLPLSEWYRDITSEWTLDYPPLFAFFEYTLANLAVLADPHMLNLTNLNYTSVNTVLFMRWSVIVTELLLFVAVYLNNKPVSKKFKLIPTENKKKDAVKGKSEKLVKIDTSQFILAAFAFNPLLILIDHIHFQYNAFLFAILFLSLACLRVGKFILGSFLFAVLLCFKHIYLYLALPFFVYILSAYCFKDKRMITLEWLIVGFSILRFAKVGLTVISVFLLSFGMFLGQLPQVVARMFPFGRGLMHSYWAGNIWALYAFIDRLLVHVVPVITGSAPSAAANLTRGLLGITTFTYLPQITPTLTLILTLLTQLPSLLTLFHFPSHHRFLDTLVLSAFSSFMLGWHVHEKAVMLIALPMTLRMFESPARAKVWLFVTSVGGYGLFPLVFGGLESGIKVCILVGFAQGAMMGFRYVFGRYAFLFLGYGSGFQIGRWESVWLWMMVPLYVGCELVHPSFGWAMRLYYVSTSQTVESAFVVRVVDKIAFVPLMATSVYVALGLLHSWFIFYRLTSQTNKIKKA